MNEKRKLIVIIFVGIIACIIVFGTFVYPGIYKYEKLEQNYPVKINRFTGHTKILTSNGWYEVEELQETETSPAQ